MNPPEPLPLGRVDTLTATMDQLQAEIDRLQAEVLLVVGGLFAVAVITTIGLWWWSRRE